MRGSSTSQKSLRNILYEKTRRQDPARFKREKEKQKEKEALQFLKTKEESVLSERAVVQILTEKIGYATSQTVPMPLVKYKFLLTHAYYTLGENNASEKETARFLKKMHQKLNDNELYSKQAGNTTLILDKKLMAMLDAWLEELNEECKVVEEEIKKKAN